MNGRFLRLLSMTSILWADTALADDVSLRVPPEEATVDVGGRQFGLFEVDFATARRATDAMLERIETEPDVGNPGGVQLRDCRVVRVVELNDAGSPAFFLGMCDGSFANQNGQTDFCFSTQDNRFTVGQWSDPPVTAGDLPTYFPECLIENCGGQGCD